MDVNVTINQPSLLKIQEGFALIYESNPNPCFYRKLVYTQTFSTFCFNSWVNIDIIENQLLDFLRHIAAVYIQGHISLKKFFKFNIFFAGMELYTTSQIIEIIILIATYITVVLSCGGSKKCSWTTCRTQYQGFKPAPSKGECTWQTSKAKHIYHTHSKSSSCPASTKCTQKDQQRYLCMLHNYL